MMHRFQLLTPVTRNGRPAVVIGRAFVFRRYDLRFTDNGEVVCGVDEDELRAIQEEAA